MGWLSGGWQQGRHACVRVYAAALSLLINTSSQELCRVTLRVPACRARRLQRSSSWWSRLRSRPGAVQAPGSRRGPKHHSGTMGRGGRGVAAASPAPEHACACLPAPRACHCSVVHAPPSALPRACAAPLDSGAPGCRRAPACAGQGPWRLCLRGPWPRACRMGTGRAASSRGRGRRGGCGRVQWGTGRG